MNKTDKLINFIFLKLSILDVSWTPDIISCLTSNFSGNIVNQYVFCVIPVFIVGLSHIIIGAKRIHNNNIKVTSIPNLKYNVIKLTVKFTFHFVYCVFCPFFGTM